MTKRIYRELTTDELDALQAFAKDYGRTWKSALNNTYWYNARVWRNPVTDDNSQGYILHGLRNTHGPDWLDGFKLPAMEANADTINIGDTVSFVLYGQTKKGKVTKISRDGSLLFFGNGRFIHAISATKEPS